MDRWQDELESQELRESPVLDRFKTPEEAYKSVVEGATYRGRSIGLPGDDPTPEDLVRFDKKIMEKVPGLVRMPNGVDPEDDKRFWNQVGVPEDIDGYVPPADVDVLNEDMMQQLKDISHKAGLTKAQYENVISQYAEAATQMAEQSAAAREEETGKLKQHWGAAYDENIGITDNMVKQFQDEKVEVGELNNAGRIMLLNMAKSMSSDPQVFNQNNKPQKGKTPAELRVEAEDIRLKLLDSNIKGEKRKILLKRYNNVYEELEPYSVQ